MLVQIAENKHLLNVFKTLISDDGSEVYLKPASDYVSLQIKTNSYTLVEACAKRNETFLGYRLKSDSTEEGIYLNPKKDIEVTFNKGDSIIVLSED